MREYLVIIRVNFSSDVMCYDPLLEPSSRHGSNEGLQSVLGDGFQFHISTMLTVRSYWQLNCLYICMYVSIIN